MSDYDDFDIYVGGGRSSGYRCEIEILRNYSTMSSKNIIAHTYSPCVCDIYDYKQKRTQEPRRQF